MAWRVLTCRLLVAVTLLGGAGVAAASAVDDEKAAGVMAAYLRHIAALTTWPVSPAGADLSRQPIVIGVLGDDPNGVIAPIRSRIASSQSLLAQGRPIELSDLDLSGLRGGQLAALLEPCALLFLSADSDAMWAMVRPVIATMPIVTVSEMAGFARRGGMVEYLVDLASGKVRLIVNVRAMRQAGVVLSARLLALESVTVLGGREDA
ncbi:MAG: YfiR family protein [Pseudomonadales bacterium]